MIVAVLVAFCCAVAGYFCWVTLGFSMALTNVPVPAQWFAPLSIAKTCGVGLIVLGLLFFSCRRQVLCTKRLLIGVMLSLMVGISWSFSAHDRFVQNRVQAFQVSDMEGVVIGLPEIREDKVTFLFRPKNLVNMTERLRGMLLRVTWRYPKQDVEPGQIWRLSLHLNPSDSTSVSGTAYVRGGGQGSEYLGTELTYHSIRFWLKQSLLSTINKYNSREHKSSKGSTEGSTKGNAKESTKGSTVVLQSTQLKALLLALLLGDRSLLTPIDWQLLSDTGTTHLMAISGLHIGLVASLVYVFFLYSFRLLRVSNIGSVMISGFHFAHLMALFAAWMYGAMAGYSVPTQRACLTVTVVVILRLVYPVINPWLAVLISASVVLLFDPISILSASFWLTFVAVTFIFCVLQGRVARLPVLSSWIRVQLALFVGLFPLSVGYFGKVSLVSILANLIAVPVVGWLVVPLAFLCSAVMCCGVYFEAITYGIIGLIGRVVSVLILFLEEVQAWGAVLLFPQPSNVVVWLAVLGAVILCLPRAVPGKWAAFAMFIPLFVPLLAPIFVMDGREGAESAFFDGGALGYINDMLPVKESNFVIDVLPSSSVMMAIDQGSSLVLVGASDIPAYRIQYLFSRYLQSKGIKNNLKEPVFSAYRQWISEEYFVLEVHLESRPFMQWAAVSIESIPVCADEIVGVKAVSIESLVIEGRCQLLLFGKNQRYLIVKPGSIQQQLAFLRMYKSSLMNRDITGLLVADSKQKRPGRTDARFADALLREVLLSGALLNTVSPKVVMFLGQGASGGVASDKIDARLLGRLKAREIKVKNPKSKGLLLKL